MAPFIISINNLLLGNIEDQISIVNLIIELKTSASFKKGIPLKRLK